MGASLNTILFNGSALVRLGGLTCIAIISTYVLVAESARTKLAPGTIVKVAACAVLAAICVWTVPTLINYARIDTERYIVPDHPVGGYHR